MAWDLKFPITTISCIWVRFFFILQEGIHCEFYLDSTSVNYFPNKKALQFLLPNAYFTPSFRQVNIMALLSHSYWYMYFFFHQKKKEIMYLYIICICIKSIPALILVFIFLLLTLIKSLFPILLSIREKMIFQKIDF